jgi:GNAT superfamily N-acetyltransferase
MKLSHRKATIDDVPLLAQMNRELTEDEGHRNRFRALSWFAKRMEGFLSGEYSATIFELHGRPVAYALYRPHVDRKDSLYLRQLYVARAMRRQGIGRQAIRLLREEIWPPGNRITVEALAGNASARAFYAAVGFTEYCIELELEPVGDC